MTVHERRVTIEQTSLTFAWLLIRFLGRHILSVFGYLSLPYKNTMIWNVWLLWWKKQGIVCYQQQYWKDQYDIIDISAIYTNLGCLGLLQWLPNGPLAAIILFLQNPMCIKFVFLQLTFLCITNIHWCITIRNCTVQWTALG